MHADNVQFVLVGGGPSLQEAKDLAALMGLSEIHVYRTRRRRHAIRGYKYGGCLRQSRST